MRILVVDDNPSVTALLSHALNRGSLQGLGADVHVNCWVAAGGRQALEQLGRTPFDAIITDVCLPEIDGKILISTIRRQRLYANLPIIAISGAGDVAERMALTAGANVYIDKPLRLRQIVEALRFLLHLHTDHDEGPQR